MVDSAHHSVSNTTVGRAAWLRKVQNEVLGKKYWDSMRMGYNNALKSLTRQNENAAAARGGVTEVDFSFRGKRPFTQQDVTRDLFSKEVTDMVKSGRLEEPLALLYKWGYYLAMEGCSVKWLTKATADYI